MNMKWFKDCKNIEEAKELYKKLCRKYHPDLSESDTTEAMKSINNEFEQIFKTLMNTNTKCFGTITVITKRRL